MDTDSRWQRCFLYVYMSVTLKKESGRGDGIGQVDKRGRVKFVNKCYDVYQYTAFWLLLY